MIFSSNIYSETLKVGVQGKYKPYYIDMNHGLELDIVNEVFKRIGIKADYYKFPFERLKSAVSKHNMDASLIAYDENNDNYYYSDDYISFSNTIVCNQSKNIKIKNLKSLAGKKVGSWRSANLVLGKDFHDNFKPGKNNYIEISDLDPLLRMFWLKRLDCIVVDLFVFKWFKEYKLQEANIKEFPVDYHHLLTRRTYFKVKFKNKEIRDRFNIALKKLKDNGFIKGVYKKYIPHATEDDLKWSLDKNQH